MAATNVGITGAALTAGAAAQTIELTREVREVAVTNFHATQYLMVSVAEGTFLANPAVTPVVGADDLIAVPPLAKSIVWRNNRVKKLINLSIIASGATTPCYAEGRLWVL